MDAVLLGFSVLACGAAVGFVAGLLGVGGGALVTPLLRLGYGVDILTATATSLFTILPTALSGAVRHIRNGYANVKVGLLIGLTGAVCSVAGALWAGALPSEVLTLVTALTILCPGATIVWSIAHQKRHPDNRPIPRFSWGGTRLSGRDTALGLAAGAADGLLCGMVGVGAAVLLTPILLLGFKMEMHEMAGTSSLVICLSAVPAVIAHALAGDVDWALALLIAAGSIPAAQLGARLTPKVPAIQLKYAFAGLLALCSAAMVLNALL